MTDPTPHTPTRDEAVLNPLALEALENNQRQLDMDGVEVGVSRQALGELLSAYKAAVARVNRATDAEIGGIPRTFASAPAPASGRVDAVAVLSTLNRMVTDYLVPDTYKARFPESNIPWHSDFPMPDKHHSEAGAHQVNLRRDQAFIRDVIHLQDNPSGIKPREPASLSPAATSGLAMPSREWMREKIASDPDVDDCGATSPTSGSEAGGDWRSVLTGMVEAMNRYGHEVGDGDIPSAHRNLISQAERLLAETTSPVAEDVRALAVVRMFKERIERHGNWDEGCFYYGNTSASELQEPLRLATAALAKPASSPAGGEVVVTPAMVNAAWNAAKDRRMTGLPTDFRAVLEAALSQSTSAGRVGE